MTSAVVTSNDFLVVMQERCTRAKSYIENASQNPSAPLVESLAVREESGSLPVANSDALGDALQQIKAVANAGATHTANQAQNEISTSVSNFMQSAKDGSAVEKFRESMRRSGQTAKVNANQAIDKAYDTAIELVSNMSPSDQNAVVNLMDNIGGVLSNIYSKINSFILNAIETLQSWINNAFEAIKALFSQIAAYIKSVL
ncbi:MULTISPECIES: hypothetical protein [Pseudomonas]|jgi:gas vesicle protein|uniref:Uncharacterized protein n=2 Tax=Pseudomonas proteolytica TaxID=219574 RepID=A0AAW5AGC5_9PSED|nr:MULTISPECIES: hypothetical protein [Pseudomonas]SUD45042.1 Phage-related protein [Pseudomonas fluorescens]KAA8697093.1 hypothetical protein F4W61_27375 [Pseudomonas proteolytica]MCF5060193.1 hypothetical protein [Pseudomonas proteolytica]NMX51270.1 hypothetical protein [Pseudomonas veronii]TWR72636.1 hypothetical protein FIV38_28095 [Pseudomonas proteolytica]